MTRKEQINSFTTDKLLELGPAFSENGIQYNNGYIRGLIEGAEWADEHPVNYDGKAMLHILEKGVKQGKRELIDKACEFFAPYIPDNSGGYDRALVIERFKNYINYGG